MRANRSKMYQITVKTVIPVVLGMNLLAISFRLQSKVGRMVKDI